MWHSTHCMCFKALIAHRFSMWEIVLMSNHVFVDGMRV